MKKYLAAFLIVLLVAVSVYAGVGDIVAKDKLSGSTSGMGIKIDTTGTPGTLIHTAVTGTTNFDEVWAWAFNSYTTALEVTVEYGAVTDPESQIKQTIPKDSGLFLLLPGVILQNGLVVRAYASAANVVFVYGFVNEMQ